MSTHPPLSLYLPTADDTDRLGAWFAARLGPGDVVLLHGQIGAGKTQFSRALIRARLGRNEDVPSPTFTLVQAYEVGETEIWHADLYRLSHPDEVTELGLEAAFETAICLVEWPEKLGDLTPKNALTLRFSLSGEGRKVEISAPAHSALLAELMRDWAASEDRAALSQSFVAQAGWGDAERRFLAGDASDRSYDRLTRGNETAVLMDAPPGKGDDPESFVAVARHLHKIGLSAPDIFAKDLSHGFLLLEDLGDQLFARVIPADPALETPLYAAATDVLVHLQSCDPIPGLPDLTGQDWAKAAAFVIDWYRYAICGTRADPDAFVATLAECLAKLADGPRVMILRDYHAENLLWLPHRAGLRRVGLLDFQLAQMGQPGYDLVSLLQDARRDVALPVELAMKQRFAERTGTTEAGFDAAYAALGAQRALRILGIFARLCLQGGKPNYLPLIPRVWGHLQRNLAHPALAPLAAICHDLLPEPTPERLERIRTQCGTVPTP